MQSKDDAPKQNIQDHMKYKAFHCRNCDLLYDGKGVCCTHPDHEAWWVSNSSKLHENFVSMDPQTRKRKRDFIW